MKLIFLGPNETVLRTMLYDWNEARAKTEYPVIIIVYDLPDKATIRFTSESGITLCKYTEIGSLDRICSDATDRIRRQSLANNPMFQGAVDGFDGASTFYGWVALWGPAGLVPGLTVSASRSGNLIGAVKPDAIRPSISGGDDCPTGFTLLCQERVPVADIVTQVTIVSATDPLENMYKVAFSDDLLSKLQSTRRPI